MAQSSEMIHTPLSEPRDLLQSHAQTDPDYLTWVSSIVSTNKGKIYKLARPAGATWTVGDLNDTIYKDDDEMVYEWENFYLEEEISTQVLGTVQGMSLSGEQLVLMTCEDTKIYLYCEMELFLVAPSLEHLCNQGINYPPSVTYYRGDAFSDGTEEDWEDWKNWKKRSEARKLDEDHQFMMAHNMMKHPPKNQ